MIVAVLLTLAMGAEPATAAPVAAPAAAPAAKPGKGEGKDGDRIVCRYEEVVGSHRAQKTCHTAREWKLMTENAQDFLRNGSGVGEKPLAAGSSPQ